MMTHSRSSVALLAVAACLVLAGCTAVEDAATTQMPAVQTPSATSSPVADSLVDSEAAGVGMDANPECEGTPGLVPVSDDIEDRVFGYRVEVIKDQGPTEHASGEATLDSDGTPVAYTVAAGDTASAISERFCIGYVDYLGWINSVRRNGVDQLYAGDTLNLDRFRITAVGDENGVVYENDPGIHIPPQKD